MTYHLTSTGSSTRQHLSREFDVACGLVRQLASDKVVDCELDGLLWRHTDKLGKNTGIETLEAFVLNDLLRAVDRVLVQDMSNAGAPLVLHPRLDQINWVDHEGTKGTS